MAKVTIIYEEEDEHLGTRVMVLSRDKEDLSCADMMYFFSESMRACGYDSVNRVGYATAKGAQFWSEF